MKSKRLILGLFSQFKAAVEPDFFLLYIAAHAQRNSGNDFDRRARFHEAASQLFIALRHRVQRVCRGLQICICRGRHVPIRDSRSTDQYFSRRRNDWSNAKRSEIH
jgi:hypothetical protein